MLMRGRPAARGCGSECVKNDSRRQTFEAGESLPGARPGPGLRRSATPVRRGRRASLTPIDGTAAGVRVAPPSL